MQFNSLLFGLFFPIVFVVYWLVGAKRRGVQNLLLLAANCAFYAWWDVRLLGLLLAGSLMDWGIGWAMGGTQSATRKRSLLAISLIVNLGLLGFFKYYNFFVESFADLLAIFGLHGDLRTLQLILPLGISFYTFQRLTYPIEIFRGRLTPTRDLTAFLAFSSFFPLMSAGPIERAGRLLPQFLKARSFDLEKSKDTLRQILWGLFRKIVIADNLVAAVNSAFSEYKTSSGIDLAVGLFLFAVQIYADFAAYSDIAMGCGRLLGFRIMRNFAYPYFSRDISEFWHRWHISMSSWFRDYVYTPLSWTVSLDRKWRRMWNVLVTFAVSGLWHGANWTFVVWGTLHGLFFIPLVFGRAPQHESSIAAEGKLFPSLRELRQMTVTFVAVLIAWVFFRSATLSDALGYLQGMVTHSWLTAPRHGVELAYSCGLLALEWLRRDRAHSLEVAALPVPARWLIYTAVILAILVFGKFGVQGFFYVQF